LVDAPLLPLMNKFMMEVRAAINALDARVFGKNTSLKETTFKADGDAGL
jgi:hypothetical protein